MAKTPPGISRADFIRCVDWVIRERKTRKILAGPRLDPDVPAQGSGKDAFDRALREIVAVAGWAPFHYPSTPEIPEPWRFYVLDRNALDEFHAAMADLLAGKLPQILGAAGAMIQVTWSPETSGEKSHLNWEHAAASAAAVQNLLLASEARGLGVYWSSSNQLASETAFELCGIPPAERYLGSVFIGHPLPDDREETDGISGKLRPKRTPPESRWAKWVVVKRRP
jgi:nitroreductase